MKGIGVVIADRGAAIVTVEHEPFIGPIPKDAERAEMLLATGIERLPFDLAAVTDRVLALDEPEARFVIDGEGLGRALWTVVGGPADPYHWQLYTGRGLERQALVDELLVAVQEQRFNFAPGLDEMPAMSKAMVGYRRQIKEDGLIGSELVVALLLAIHQPQSAAVQFFG